MKKLDLWLLSLIIGVVTFFTACEELPLEEINPDVSSDTTSVEEEKVLDDSASTATLDVILSIDTTQIIVGDSVKFTATANQDSVSWFWEFEGGTPATSTEEDPSVVYETAGSFGFTLKVTSSKGDTTITKEAHITVKEGEIAKTGLLAYYPFNGNTNDESGNDHHATATGGEFAADRSGNTNSAFYITSKSDALDIDDFANEQISVSLWYYYEGADGFWNTLLYGNNSRHHLLVSYSDNYGTKNELGTYIQGFQESDYILEENQWHHMVLMKDGSETKLYVDKSLVMETTDFSNADHPLTVIGNFDANNGTQGALGKLDEIKIYGKLLTSKEIEYLFNK